jgi:leader peptidase (prepilin peptidase)/N-methyltransferase
VTLVSGAVGLFVGLVLNLLSEYMPQIASSQRPTRNLPQHWFVPAVLQLLIGLLSTQRRRPSRSLTADAAVELVTASLFSYLWLRFGLSWNAFLPGLVGSFLILIALIDLKYRVILNVLLLPAAIITLLVSLMPGGTNPLSLLLGGGFALVVFAFAALVRPGELGAGDVKLATLVGLIFGFPNVIVPLLTGVLAGGITALVLILKRQGNRSTQIPYAPFLCVGALFALLFGTHGLFSLP